MIVGHIVGIPVEESVLELAPAAAAIAGALVVAVREKLRRMQRSLRHESGST